MWRVMGVSDTELHLGLDLDGAETLAQQNGTERTEWTGTELNGTFKGCLHDNV